MIHTYVRMKKHDTEEFEIALAVRYIYHAYYREKGYLELILLATIVRRRFRLISDKNITRNSQQRTDHRDSHLMFLLLIQSN